MILEIGISSMSRPPAARSAGISVLTPRLGTTASTACMSPLASDVIVGEDMAGRINLRWCEKRHLCEKVPDLYADRDKSRASGS